MKRTVRISIVLALILVLGFILVGCGTQSESDTGEQDKKSGEKAEEPKKLVISTWGYNEDKLRKNVFDPFEEANNVEIILEVGNNADRLNKIRMNKNSEVDVIFLAHSYAMDGAKEGLFEKINRDNIPNIENIYDIAKAPLGEEYGPAYTINRTGIIYDTAAVEEPIESWTDLWREDLKGNLSIPKINTTSGPAMLLAAADKAGVSIKDDYRAAFEELKKIKPNLVKPYARSSELANMFAQGEITVGVAMDFAYAGIKKAVPTAKWVDPREGSFANVNVVNIVKGTDNKELAEKFINWLLSEEVQRANALDKVDSPVNVNVELTEEEAKGLTYGKELINSLQPVDWGYINGVKSEWIDIWNKEILQ